MSNDMLPVEDRQPVHIITGNRPDKLNALDRTLAAVTAAGVCTAARFARR
ncbi:MAG: hypothetical protein QM581_01655 [Pseudomonas sp.]